MRTIVVDAGNVVLCDGCSEDYTDSPATGGLLFASRAVGPCCAAEWEAGAKRHGEERFISARCPAGKSFADWVREDLR